MAISLATAARNASTDATVDLIDGGTGAGKLQLRTGTRPATPNDAATGTLLAEVVLSDPAYGSSASGTAALSHPPTVNAVASGTPTWFRVLDSAGGAVFDGNVGTDLVLTPSAALVAGAAVDIVSLSYTTPAAA